jgi:hypothetical protein
VTALVIQFIVTQTVVLTQLEFMMKLKYVLIFKIIYVYVILCGQLFPVRLAKMNRRRLI